MIYTQELDPSTNATIKIKLFCKVDNVQQLRSKIMDEKLKCCLIKPCLIFDPFQIAVAANKTMLSRKLTTKNIYTELLFNLSISKNITQSLRNFGIEEIEKELLLVVIDKNDSKSTFEDISNQILGEEIDIQNLESFSSITEIQKAYKLTDFECNEQHVLNSIVSKIASKDFL